MLLSARRPAEPLHWCCVEEQVVMGDALIFFDLAVIYPLEPVRARDDIMFHGDLKAMRGKTPEELTIAKECEEKKNYLLLFGK